MNDDRRHNDKGRLCVAVLLVASALCACDRDTSAKPPAAASSSDPTGGRVQTSAVATGVASRPPAKSGSCDGPALPAARPIAEGVAFHEVQVLRAGIPMRLWIYLPTPTPTERIPAVFIAPAGSRLFHGMKLADGDRPEHLPYVLAGHAVVAYELDGHLPDKATDEQTLAAARSFHDADAGLDNARCAIDYALARMPIVDPSRLYAAGHSSAATVSLVLAENEPRIAACIAYAPGVDVPGHLASAMPWFEEKIPGYRDFAAARSPDRGTDRLSRPTFIFNAEDDTVTPIAATTAFVERLKKTNPRVAFVRARSGGHHESMISEGIPKAITWLASLEKH
jgi:dienelactone hydrolase